jgi:hypothetical protein
MTTLAFSARQRVRGREEERKRGREGKREGGREEGGGVG